MKEKSSSSKTLKRVIQNLEGQKHLVVLSFLLALALTFLFSVLVSLVMHRKLKKIDMVESLKSIE